MTVAVEHHGSHTVPLYVQVLSGVHSLIVHSHGHELASAKLDTTTSSTVHVCYVGCGLILKRFSTYTELNIVIWHHGSYAVPLYVQAIK